MVERAGRDVIEVRCPADDSGRFSLDLPGIEAGLAAGAGSVVLCNPWNPTGRVLDETELGDLVEVVRRHDARLITDEIHAPIVYPGNAHIPAARLDSELVVTVASASKAWNLPGLKCAQVVLTNEEDRSRWSTYFTPAKVGVGTFGLIANAAAYRSSVDWFDQTLARLESNRDLFVELVAEHLPEAVCHPPQGTYLGWIDLTRYELGNPTAYMLDTARVALTSGTPFGGEAGQFARFNFGTDPSLIAEMLERMGKAVTER
jgi:cystathionine beta-lyase